MPNPQAELFKMLAESNIRYRSRTSAATDMDVDAPHSITTPNGEALYIPGIGIIDP